MNSPFDRLSTPAASSVKLEAAMADEAGQLAGDAADGRPYYGKCQYKTGKCFNERTLKRNGEVHSLCEEHRIKQNLIQRRSDRKYQTVHAIRRRERSQRRAVLKKQVSMAVAQQLFYEHQQQKTLGVHLATSAVTAQQQQAPAPVRASHHHAMGSLAHAHPAPASVASLVPPISIPTMHHQTHHHHHHHHQSSPFLASSAEGLASPILSFSAPSAFSNTRGNAGAATSNKDKQSQDDGDDSEDMDQEDAPGSDDDAQGKREAAKPEDGTPTGIDDFTPDAFLNLCCGEDSDAFATFAPILSARAERELWTESDIDFLQTLLLA